MVEKKIIHDNKSTDKVYVNKAITRNKLVSDGNGGVIEAIDYNIRVISKVTDSPEQYSYVQLKDEVVLRKTGKGRQEIKATVVEDSKDIQILTIQRFTSPSGKPHESSFSFVGDEIEKLYDFIIGISKVKFDSENAFSFNEKQVSQSDQILNEEVKELVIQNDELLREIIYSGVTKDDLVTLGYRKRQLEVFNKLINDPLYFEDLKKRTNTTNEGLWQRFLKRIIGSLASV